MSVTLPSELTNKILNGFFEDNSFVSGVEFSDADTTVFKALVQAPGSDLPHLARWFKHVESKVGPSNAAAAPAAAAAAAEEDDDDDIDLFGSDDEVDEEAEKLKQQRLEEYRAKKAAKGPGPAAKSMIILDVKPWDDETDLKAMEESVRSITMDGLVWGKAELVAIGYGIKKLRITCVVEDAKVSTDDLEAKILDFEDYVQSMDVEAFNKL
ncbi:Translation elongation factor 1 beta [Mycoemilia scoparia]|uniref:Translation elongation factor 1 beta n=1 Tax=Mycoemilia scoparia TaxID=417184 RepID=A0A9W8A2X1_9FUNG|nr:Translation elongation factor 1 beta [Mycoemilia scoparia]